MPRCSRAAAGYRSPRSAAAVSGRSRDRPSRAGGRADDRRHGLRISRRGSARCDVRLFEIMGAQGASHRKGSNKSRANRPSGRRTRASHVRRVGRRGRETAGVSRERAWTEDRHRHPRCQSGPAICRHPLEPGRRYPMSVMRAGPLWRSSSDGRDVGPHRVVPVNRPGRLRPPLIAIDPIFSIQDWRAALNIFFPEPPTVERQRRLAPRQRRPD